MTHQVTSAAGPAGVAIIGMACRFPGAADHRAFWRNLCEGVESISALTDADLVAAGVPGDALRDPAYVKATPLLADADRFDAGFFEYSPHEARVMDPQQRLLLEVAWEAFEDAGQRPGPARPVGVFVGTGGVVSSYLVDRLHSSADLPGQTGSLAHIGNDKDFASTRISYKLNLTGPSLNVQTACSTSLVAVHLACQAILAGECDMALAGAATVRVPQRVGYLSQTGGILSPDGHCRAFDAEAAGTIFGSGVGAVLLKDAAAAVADGDHIYAVIRGSAINNDGADKVSYTASSVAGQARAMVEAMSVADVSPDQIGYVECHGTGTIVGDPLEVDALTRAFRTATERCGYCAIGSVKTNIGHLEQTAGVAALIKAALALHHRRIPPSLNFRRPNPKIDFAASPFFVNDHCGDWPADGRPRLAAVNSLGLGGTNAFVVLEEAPQQEAGAAIEAPAHLFALSAQTDAALAGSVERYRGWLADATAPLADVCFTLTQGRTHFPRRFVAVAGSVAELRDALAQGARAADGAAIDPGARRLAFLFSGQASQYAGMGAELYRLEPAFRRIIDRCEELLRGELELPLKEVLFGGGDAGAIDQTAYTQPALFAVQAALVELWRTWGIVPDMVLGHSVGELAAAYCAGVYSLEQALALTAGRARLMQALPQGGAMAAVFADAATVAAEIARLDPATVAIAAINAPHSTVISGEQASVSAALRQLEALGLQCRPLTVSHAFHSPLMTPAMDAFGRLAATAGARAPQCAWVSTVSGELMREAPDAPYWREHALNPVRFMQAIETLHQMGATDFVEIGPGQALLALGRQCRGDDGLAWLGSLDRAGDRRKILASLGELYRRGSAVDWDGFNAPHGGRRISLPTYAFERRRFWIDGETTAPAAASAGATAGAGLTGVRLRSPLSDIQFETAYSVARFGWLDHHRIYGMVVLPFTAGLVALQQAARQHFATDAVEIDNLQYRDAMVIAEGGDRIVQSILAPTDAGTADCRFVSTGEDAADGWRTHMVGMVRKASAPPGAPLDVAQIQARCPAGIPVERYYAAVHRLGLEYGPSFRGIEMLQQGDGEVVARVRLPGTIATDEASLHPALLDACLHVYPALVAAYGDFGQPASETRRTFLPIGIERFHSAGAPARDVWVHAVRRDGGAGEILTVDIAIHRDDGSFAAAITGLSLKPLAPQDLAPQAAPARLDWLYQMAWQERPALDAAAATAGAGAGWIVLADRGGVGRALADLLQRRGDACHIMHLDVLADAAHDENDRLLERFAAALSAVPETGAALRGVIDLWPLDVWTDDAPAAAQRIVVGVAASLFKTLAEAPGQADAAPKVWLVTRDAVAVSPDDAAAEPARASVWGLGRSASLEHPHLWGGLVDLATSPDPSPAHDAAALMCEIIHGDGEDQVALRAGRRFAARLVRTPPPPPGEARFDPDAVYLVTGGLGALGLKVAEWLVDRHGVKHIALLSRRGAGDPAAEPARRAFAARGAEIEIVTADVTNAAEMRDAIGSLRRSARALKGVFHCAGLLDDGILMQMDWPKFQRVMAPKVEGAWLLHELTRDLALDHFVLFSSILSLIGSAGQANYAAANAFLDALAARRRREGLPALALNWGPWAESGLATASGDKGRLIWRARGTAYIDAETGRQALDVLVGSGLSHGAITITQWQQFLQQFAAVPPLYRELQQEIAGVAGAAAGDTQADQLRSRLADATEDARRELLIAFVGRQAAKTLGVSDQIPVTRPLRELGLDSLMSVTLVNRLETALGIRISAAKLIRGPSIQELVDDLMPLLANDGERAAEPRPAASNGEASRWLVVVGPRAAPRYRLFCFPFAGGGSAVYRHWARALDPAVEVIAIEPPGRLGRVKETPVSDMEEFVDRLATEMDGMLDRPFAFFGHCLGALTMYETARRLIHSRAVRPFHLFASGARPPDRIADHSSFEERLTQDLLNLAEFRVSVPAFLQPDDVFAEIIRHFNIQASERLLNDPKLRELMLPVIRAEFQMAVNYQFRDEQPWDIPITCFAARGDPYVSRRHALGWGRFTNSRLQVFIREGAHFAVVDDVDFIHGVINRELRASSPVSG